MASSTNTHSSRVTGGKKATMVNTLNIKGTNYSGTYGGRGCEMVVFDSLEVNWEDSRRIGAKAVTADGWAVSTTQVVGKGDEVTLHVRPINPGGDDVAIIDGFVFPTANIARKMAFLSGFLNLAFWTIPAEEGV